MNRERALEAAAPFVTPLAVVDEEVMEGNLARMAAVAAGHRVALRPHAKTHKSAEVARRQMAHGAVGLTAATLVEAEVFAEAGIADLLVAHPPVGTAKLRRLEALAGRVRRLAVSLDDVGVAESIPTAGEGVWGVDTGLHRIGPAPGARAVVAAVAPNRPGDRAVIDAGSKALSADLRVSGLDGYGIVVGNERLCVARLSEEHAVVTGPGRTGLAIGDRIAIIPAHACTTVNLHPSLLIVPREGTPRWQAVDARGWRC